MGALADRAWTGVPAGALLAIPLGSCEQHGPHLPLSTDALIAHALAERLAAARPDVIVAPALAYGASGEHAGFAGTLSIGTEVLAQVLIELGRSAVGSAVAGVVFVNGHGGNADALALAGERLEREGLAVVIWSPTVPGGDAHAGRTETSLVLALAPHLVAMERAEAGDRRPLAVLWDALRRGGVAAVAPNGVLGDPAGASPAEGHRLLAALAAGLGEAVAARFGASAARA